jgi:type VI secretion system protein VasD
VAAAEGNVEFRAVSIDFAHPRFRLALLALTAVLAACAAKPPAPPPTVLRGAIEASAAVNPDARGRPSPIVVKVFELRSVGPFEAADFFSLFDKDREALGADVLRKEELTLRPGERVAIDRTLDPDTRYVGIVAGYRALERSRWRAHTAISAQRVNALVLTLDADGITLRQ